MEKHKEQSRAAFDRQAEKYDDMPIGWMTRQTFPAIVDKLKQLGCSCILDLGSGTGEFIKFTLTAIPHMMAYGLDISENMVNTAKAKLGSRAESDVYDIS
jgi:ubiquinone/menaquinone biosynthesis C-methylase UbiE